jgi:hypothetical protein
VEPIANKARDMTCPRCVGALTVHPTAGGGNSTLAALT